MSPNLQTGILDLSNKGQYGRLRSLKPTLSTDSDDPVVGIDLINRHQLRPGLHLEVELGGPVNGQRPGPPHRRKGKGKKKKKSHTKNSKQAIGARARRVLSVRKIEGVDAVTYQCQRKFEDLTIIDPKPRLTLEYPDCPLAFHRRSLSHRLLFALGCGIEGWRNIFNNGHRYDGWPTLTSIDL